MISQTETDEEASTVDSIPLQFLCQGNNLITFCECSRFPIYIMSLKVIYFRSRVKLNIKVNSSVEIEM
jgi:hypothetical protein